jgi:hypothetical protein
MFRVAINRKQLPESAEGLQQMVLDLIAQLDASEARRIKTENCWASYSPQRADGVTNRLPKNNWRCSRPN